VTPASGRDRAQRRRPRSRSFVRPLRPFVPVSSCLLVVLGWGVVAHNSGAGWVQALGDVVAGTLLLGTLGPAFVLARTRLHVTTVPTDATAGLPCPIGVSCSSRVRLTPVHPSGPACFVGPADDPAGAGHGDGHGAPGHLRGDEFTLLPRRRAVVSSIAVDVATAAPFGLMWWTRRRRLELPAELHIGPKIGPPVVLPRREDEHSGDSAHRSPRDIGEPRGVRPYRPGDSRRWVHWPATAHSGELMVREMEGPTAEPVVVVVTLPSDEEAAESVAERAFGTLVALFDRGTAVILTTTEVAGRRTGAVADRRSAGRRLARAVTPGAGAGAEADADPGVAVTVGDGVGTPEDAGRP
jgi:uncharacterized protein (DUF58 family)